MTDEIGLPTSSEHTVAWHAQALIQELQCIGLLTDQQVADINREARLDEELPDENSINAFLSHLTRKVRETG